MIVLTVDLSKVNALLVTHLLAGAFDKLHHPVGYYAAPVFGHQNNVRVQTVDNVPTSAIIA